MFFSCLKNNFKFESPVWCYTKKTQSCKEHLRKIVHLLDLCEMTTNFLRQTCLRASITYILSSLQTWGVKPIILWNVADVQGNPHSSELETLKKTVHSQDAVCRNCHSRFFGVVYVGAKSQSSLPHRKRSNTVVCMLTY